MTRDARRVAELVARSCYGRLVAFLASRSRDIVAAEEALAEAFADGAGDLAEVGRAGSPGSLAAHRAAAPSDRWRAAR
jgi:RNA polymerase sigma-70 factor (ECF subfamily)